MYVTYFFCDSFDAVESKCDDEYDDDGQPGFSKLIYR